MKYVLIFALLISSKANSQSSYVVVGGSVGYYNHFTAAPQLGIRKGNVYVFLSNITSVTLNATTPNITTLNVGYNIGGVQPFFSYGYQTIGREAEARFNDTPDEFINGFRPGFGLSYYFKNIPLALTGQRQGKENNFSVITYITL